MFHITSQHGLTSSIQLLISLRKLKLIGRCGNYFLHYHRIESIQILKWLNASPPPCSKWSNKAGNPLLPVCSKAIQQSSGETRMRWKAEKTKTRNWLVWAKVRSEQEMQSGRQLPQIEKWKTKDKTPFSQPVHDSSTQIYTNLHNCRT